MNLTDYFAKQLPKKESGAQYVWVRETYGRENRGTTWKHKHGHYFFKDPKDLALFLLKWS